MKPFLECALLLAWLLPLYSYLIYPLVMSLLSLRQTPAPAGGGAGSPLRDAAAALPVAVVVAAHNEEAHIDALVTSLRALTCAGGLRAYIGSDGSTDATVIRLRALAGDDLRVFAYEQNRGKASVLNDLVAASSEPIIVFTDANTLLDVGALTQLLKAFADPTVGMVCGELRLSHSGGGDNVDGLYWRVEQRLKRAEAGLGGLLGANGGIYAIRRECYVPLERDTIIDDFCIGMNIAARGWRLVYEPAAVAHELAPPNISDEVGRRIRIGIGNYQACFRHPEYLWQAGPVTAFTYLSHKVLRWFTPHCLLIALLASALLVRAAPFGLLLALQLAGYLLCALAYAASARVRLPALLRIPVFLVALNAALAVGFWRYLTGQYGGSWRRTQRG